MVPTSDTGTDSVAVTATTSNSGTTTAITGDSNTWVDTDLSDKDQKIQDIAGVVWTSTEKDALKAALILAKG